MAGYNPQRTRPRPGLAPDAPAPVDSLLDGPVEVPAVEVPAVEVPTVESPAAERPDADAPPVEAPVVDAAVTPVIEAPAPVAAPISVPDAPYIPTAPSDAQRSRSRAILLGLLALGAVVAMVVLRRRRR